MIADRGLGSGRPTISDELPVSMAERWPRRCAGIKRFIRIGSAADAVCRPSLLRFDGAACLAAILLLSLCCMPASVIAGNRAMLELLKVLRDDGTITQKAYEALYRTALEEDKGDADEMAPPGGHKDAQKSPLPAPDKVKKPCCANQPVVGIDQKGVRFKSTDGDFRFRLGGQLLLDAAWYDEDRSELDNDTLLRSSRLTWGGTLWKDWQFKTEVEFAQGDAEFKSNYLRYLGFKPLLITLGNFKEPFGLERWTPITETTFMERAAVSSVLAPARSQGLGVRSNGQRWSLGAGLFGEREQSGGGDSQIQEESWAVTGRATYLPLLSSSYLIHTGIAGSYRAFDEGQIRFKARPESNVDNIFLIDTGFITDVESLKRVGIEAGAVIGSLFLQTEYITTKTERSGALPELGFDGWYAYAGYLLTGESRPYLPQRGVFRSIVPKHPLSRGGSGAWELALRYSQLDLTDEEITGGEQELMTFGLNWYPNANTRFMANYIRVLDVDRPGSLYDGDEPQLLQIRGQVDF